jgi:DNA polymerase
MTLLVWDIETRSTADLEAAGVWRYAADSTTEVLCVGYAVDAAAPQIWLPGEPIPVPFVEAACDPDWNVIAHNWQFERAIATHILAPRFGWPLIPLEQQSCTMTMALAAALPAALENAAAALGLPDQKDRDGYRLMRQMARPRKARKGEDRKATHWVDGPKERERLQRYCLHDVEVERALYHRLPSLSPAEQALWALDAVINERGFHIDRALVEAAHAIARTEQIAINAEIAAHTDDEVTSANQVARIVAFVRRHGHALESLTKLSVSAVLACEPGDTVRRLLELRQQGARASTRKLTRLLANLDADNRLRGSLRFHGSATGRWSGRGYQPQNLKKSETKDLDAAVDALLTGDLDRVRELGAPLTIAGDVSRAMICAAPGHGLIGGDFSAIESRVLAWLAGEEWKLDSYRAFDRTGDAALEPYCVTATHILKRPVTPDDEAGRRIGKTCDLAFGYGGGLGAWRRFDTTDTHSDADVERFKTEWRHAHLATVEFWKSIQRAALQAVHTRQPIECGSRLSFAMDGGTLWLRLPSGRRLAYPQARIGPGKFDGHRAVYFHDNARGGWTETSSWYGSLTENVVQAVARDLLAAAMLRLESAGYPVVLHVHDEAVAEVPASFGSTGAFLQLMTQLPDWAAGLPVAAKPWSRIRYAKTAPPKPGATAAIIVTAAKTLATDNEDDEELLDIVPLTAVISEPLINGLVCCPFHADRTPSCRVYDDHFHCFGCGAHGDAIDWLMTTEGMDRNQAVAFLATWDGPPTPRLSHTGDESRAVAMGLWDEAQSITSTLAARYLAEHRQIDLAALPDRHMDALRFHSRCPFGPGARHPCLLGLMRDARTDVPTGIHRTALRPDGSKIDRRMLGRAGAVKLWPLGPQLVVGEGLETVLAAATRLSHHGAPLRPAWALLSSGGLERLPPIPGLERLVILVDHDNAGRAAAARCAREWSHTGCTVVRLTPKRAGADFNDIILARKECAA